MDNSEVCTQLWHAAQPQCEEVIKRPFKVIRQYANGHTYGLGGQSHHDDERSDCYTLVYYANLEWQQIWQGETLYYNEKNEIQAAVQPAPNRAVLFDARFPHVGRAASRYFGGLRVTVAYKLIASD